MVEAVSTTFVMILVREEERLPETVSHCVYCDGLDAMACGVNIPHDPLSYTGRKERLDIVAIAPRSRNPVICMTSGFRKVMIHTNGQTVAR